MPWPYKPVAELETLAKKVVGEDKTREILVYCDSGKFASVWWYLLSQSMGYKNVKLYDGSAQDFAKDPRRTAGALNAFDSQFCPGVPSGCRGFLPFQNRQRDCKRCRRIS